MKEDEEWKKTLLSAEELVKKDSIATRQLPEDASKTALKGLSYRNTNSFAEKSASEANTANAAAGNEAEMRARHKEAPKGCCSIM